MKRLEDFWYDLFGEDIDPFSKRVMEGVYEYVDPDEPLVILAAIPTFILVKVLLKDPASPFQIASKLGRAMRDLEAALTRMNANSIGAQERFENLNQRLFEAQSLVDTAGSLVGDLRRLRAPALIIERDSFDRSIGHAFNAESIKALRRLVYGACGICCVATAILTTAAIKILS